MKTIAALLVVFLSVGIAQASPKTLTCVMHQSTTNSAQLDIDESASTAFWRGGGGTGAHTSSASFTSDQIQWSFSEEDSQGTDINYTFYLTRMTGVLWQNESHYSKQFRRNVTGTISWDCSVSQSKF